MKWTSELPTEEGFYFVMEDYFPNTVQVLYVFKQHKVFHIGSAVSSRYCKTTTLNAYNKRYKHLWAGPIEEPVGIAHV